ncbi:glycosyltransferase family 4 protein [Egicoccus sp. AB-alg6-2]|uniref:glycosyltransferase family 4 protein n=1 Tax=Egicoccus sp. AB-alg6-2 TaxID=3242692 RepID=UPI00359EE159
MPPTGYGGIEWIVASLADGLVDAGHEVTLAASGGSVTRATLETVFDDAPSLHIGSPWYEATHVLAAYARPRRFDVIHDHTGAIGPAIAAGIVDRPPVLNTLHGCWTDANAPLYRAICDRVALVAISHDQASRTPADVQLAGVVHNGVALERYPFRADKEDFLLFVGRASADKGPEVAIEVADRVGLPLVMAIKVSEPLEIDYFASMIAPAMHQVDVEVRTGVGHEEKTDLMSRARAVLVPIRWDEPFGLVMAEAMACGTPVVAYRRGAAPELVRHEQTGYLVEPGDLVGFAEAATRVGDIDAHACRAWVEQRFSASRMVEQYVALYERLVARPTGVETT